MFGNIIFYTSIAIDPLPVHICCIDIIMFQHIHTPTCARVCVSSRECLQARVRACECVHECVSGTITVLKWTLLVNEPGIAFE